MQAGISLIYSRSFRRPLTLEPFLSRRYMVLDGRCRWSPWTSMNASNEFGLLPHELDPDISLEGTILTGWFLSLFRKVVLGYTQRRRKKVCVGTSQVLHWIDYEINMNLNEPWPSRSFMRASHSPQESYVVITRHIAKEDYAETKSVQKPQFNDLIIAK